jgi:hypothetical protein
MGVKMWFVDIVSVIILILNSLVVAVALYNQNWFTVALNGGLSLLLAFTMTIKKPIKTKVSEDKKVDV